MKIIVYAICKNEEKFANRWMDSMTEADEVIVLDTGSTDNTCSILKARGAIVHQETISPWRFDAARNRSLDLVPADADVCVCTDLDEIFHPGWRTELEHVWQLGTSQVRYRYTWSFNRDGSDGVVFFPEKIHCRHGFRWVHPVHEVLEWIGPGTRGPTVTTAKIQLDHHPDHSKSRSQYLPLLELSVQEAPEDDRNVHYLGREYLYQGRWDDCIRTLLRHLSMPSARWADERAASMRYIARAYLEKGQSAAARDWYLRAIAQAPHLREPYVELAHLLYTEETWDGVLYFTGCALAITRRPESYISEAAAWGSLPYDLRTMAYYHTGRIQKALAASESALALEPDNPRLQANHAFLSSLVS